MDFIRRIFGSVERSYLIRAYIFGALFFAFVMALGPRANAFLTVYFAICTVLFPFAKLVWDEAKSVILGNNIFFLPALILVVLKLFINILLWAFALFVAPLGILYLAMRTR